ncbi:nuclear transport factor 2 family protein [Azospirillum sp. B506]|uniref:nuclear transport factor 2 family protein n=1 Tax=Azospirillum sp. B506 TaxID=137721 RepID=UPI00034D4E83|nr:nuclear transport factor 2 family protein [Azospirillum sp. B506]
MRLPSPILAYIDADRRCDGAALVAAFAPDAVVRDEGRSHVGRDAIDAWWHAAKAKYAHVIEPLELSETGGVAELHARVSGRFPGSPATMVFSFRVANGRIAGLEIAP